ncbi:MAG: hypothetical protein JST00_26660 [Deltaproteobacteria bacterium]|nr:hypothetical protein [Deltaproteobacteria bacterium]
MKLLPALASATLLSIVTLGSGCATEVEDEPDEPIATTTSALAAGYQRLQNANASFIYRCLVASGVAGAQVPARTCTLQDENQGFKWDKTASRQWIISQTTGKAKCLTRTAANDVVLQPCVENQSSQKWARTVTTTPAWSRYTFKSDNGGCLALNEAGDTRVAPCDGTRDQQWTQPSDGTDVPLLESLSGGPLNAREAQPGALVGEISIPASGVTKAATGGVVQRWTLYPIYYRPKGIDYESAGMIMIGRDGFGAARTLFKVLRTRHPSVPNDFVSEWRAIPADGNQAQLFRTATVEAGKLTAVYQGRIAFESRVATAIALLVRDLEAWAKPTARAAAAAPKPAAIIDAVVAAVADGELTATDALDLASLIPVVGIFPAIASAYIQGNPMNGKPGDASGGSPNCGFTEHSPSSGWPGADTCRDHPPLHCTSSDPQKPSVWSCFPQSVKNVTSAPWITPWNACSRFKPGIGMKCTLYDRLTETSMDLCKYRCTQDTSFCDWAWCRKP